MNLSALRVAIIVFPGSNCDRDMMVAIEQLTSRRPALVWHKEATLEAADLVIIPGGFSFGDYLRCGALAGRSPIMNALLDHAARGGAVLGICNGFQILTEMAMVPGVLIRNAGLKFTCRNVDLQVCETVASPFSSGLAIQKKLRIPVAHNEGNYFAEPNELEKLNSEGQIIFRYVNGDSFGLPNPNGAADNIAGVLSKNGRVLGMMPHPERAMLNLHGGTDGAHFLLKSLEALLS
ncbi:phosphoribosylformylglycinamidine synthase subunit PurQ [Candidatus Puniceispirillum sp.]|nr:phosphoribosylformylglycinamidine synthase subunit PurQ [Candidatus Puniceispirillum sp.]